MTSKPPTFKSTAFNCPHCAAYAHMHWEHLWFQRSSWVITEAFIVVCGHCRSHSYWLGKEKDSGNSDYSSGVMIYPSLYTTPMPHPDMPSDIRTDYEEAREIAGKSPRAAAALLRLCVQKLCKHLGEPGENINKDIGALVQKGLPVEIQQALDIVRVIGNNAVHPGEISPDDVANVSATLFELVNYIVDLCGPSWCIFVSGTIACNQPETFHEVQQSARWCGVARHLVLGLGCCWLSARLLLISPRATQTMPCFTRGIFLRVTAAWFFYLAANKSFNPMPLRGTG